MKPISKTAWFLTIVGAILLILAFITGIPQFTGVGIVCLLAAVVEYLLRVPGIWGTIKRVVVLAIGGGATLLVVAAVGVWLYFRPAQPDAFYTPPSAVPTTPGTLIRSEPTSRGVPEGAQGWRILYTTTQHDGSPAVASGIVLAPTAAPAGPHPVIAWTHGTTGADPACAPSVLPAPYPFDPTIPALDQVVDQGWIFVATDYPGLGTQGPAPYLIGEGEARSALDAVRAARQLPDIQMEDRTVVWGHSQGGHAALWTGILAPRYAPDVGVIGVAALAPASDVAALVEGVQNTDVGKIITTFLLRAYAETYPDVRFDELVRPGAGWMVRDIATRCLALPSALASIVEVTRLLDGPIWAVSPSSNEALARRMAENTPREPIAAPLLIAQGLSDELVLPDVQKAFVLERCAAGQSLEFRTYAGKDHVGVVAPDSPLNQDLVAWTLARLANEPPAAGCQTIER
jgi:alpha-beta hydrolase superfamily lysophospholipase